MKEIVLRLNEEQIRQVTGEKKQYDIDSREIANCSIEYIIYNLKHKIDNTLPGDNTRTRDGERYNFIPAPFGTVSEEFLTLLSHARENKKPIRSFLDVGCGIGNIMLIPHSLNILSHGIEYDKKVLDYSLFPILRSRQKGTTGIYHMDAFDFKRYSDYDVIYFYCPMCERDLEKKLELKIMKEMDEGAYLFAYPGIDTTPDFKSISNHVWLKEVDIEMIHIMSKRNKPNRTLNVPK